MPIYEHVDAATSEVMSSFWSAVTIVTEQAQITEVDALMHMKRSIIDRVRSAKPTELVDYTPDGRAALWRVRLMVWKGHSESDHELFADTDAPAHLDSPGSTLIQGLPGVAEWVWSMLQVAHPDAVFQDLNLVTLKHKLRTLRVALSNQQGPCAWRHRYLIGPGAPLPTAPDPQPDRAGGQPLLRSAVSQSPRPFMAIVRVAQEAPAPRR